MFKIGDEVQIKMKHWEKLRENKFCMPEFKDNRYIGRIVKILTRTRDSDYIVEHPTGIKTNWSKENIERALAENEI